MDEDVLRAEGDRGVDQTVQVRLQRVHAAVGEQAREVNRAAVLHRIDERRVRFQLVPRDGLADAHDVLIDDPSRADIEMPDLGVAHLIARQTDGAPRGLERRPRRFAKEPVEARRVGLRRWRSIRFRRGSQSRRGR